MQANPLWPVERRFPKIRGDLRAEVAIVGGGITGISSAYHLQRKGHDVVVIEEAEVGSAASGASSGILYYGSGTNLLEAISLYGEEKAAMLWRESRETIRATVELIEEEDLEAGLVKTGAIMVAKNEAEMERLQRERNALKAIGIDTEAFSGPEVGNHFTGRVFRAGLHFPECVQIRPAVFAASVAAEFNLRVYENTPYTSFEETAGGITLRTQGSSIRSDKVLFATNLRPFFGLEAFFAEESSVIVSSRPLMREKLKSIWPEPTLIWTMEEQYDIVYPAENRLILELYRLKGVKEKLAYYYPQGFDRDAQWGDSWARSGDWLPIAGSVGPRIYAAVAMGDQGVVMGSTVGRKMPLLLEGGHDAFLGVTTPARFR